MNILCIFPFNDADAPVIENRTLPLLRSITLNHDYHVDVIFPGQSNPLALNKAEEILRKKQDRHFVAKSPTSIQQSFLYSLRRAFKWLASPRMGHLLLPLGGVDWLSVTSQHIVHATSYRAHYNLLYISKPWLQSAGVGLWLKFRWKVPAILDLDDYEIVPKSLLLRSVDAIVVASYELYRLFSHYSPLYIPNSTDLDFFDPNKYKVKKASPCQIIWSGVMYSYLKLENLIRAVSLMKQEAHLVFSGRGPKMTELLKEAVSLDVKSNVYFLKWSNRSVVPKRLATASIAVNYTSDNLYERSKCPGKIFEYMAMELPIVTTNVGEAARIVKKAGCGILVEPETPLALAEAFDYLVQNPEERKKLGLKGREFLLRHQNYRLLGDKLAHYLEEVTM